jgi:hypothetical protein
MYNINQDKKGDIAAAFINFSITESRPIIETSVRESSSHVAIGDTAKEALLNYNKK